MSLRVYFNTEELRKNENVISWYHPLPDLKGIDLREAQREQWSNFGIFDVRIRFDEHVGLPYVELHHLQLHTPGWKKIAAVPKNTINHVLLIDAWSGTQPAGVYIERGRYSTISASLKHCKDIIHCEIRGFIEEIEQENYLIMNTISAYWAIRGKSFDRFDIVRYD